MHERSRSVSDIELDFINLKPEKKGQYQVTQELNIPEYNEIESIDELRNVDKVIANLQSIDWNFTTDDTRFLTHGLHSYPAKFIPQIPGHLIAQLSLRGELIFDPFGGSGTTAFEAIRLGRRALSVDANPVGTLIGKVKTCKLDQTAITDLHAITCALKTLQLNIPCADNLCEKYNSFIPEISNIDKWFPQTSRGELAFIRSKIAAMESNSTKDIALLALSKIAISSSFQDSETRYSSKPRSIPQGETLKQFLIALNDITLNVIKTQPSLKYGVCDFITADSRQFINDKNGQNSVDLIVTSPPYGNANDYHLYHRFRLLWLGHDPKQFAKIEIGSHLRHQRESTGFDSYIAEMKQALCGMYQMLKPGRYAVIVVGDAIYEKNLYLGAESISKVSQDIGFETVCIIERKIHGTKRSFIAAGRRASTEKLLVLRKPPCNISIWLQPPPYKMWHYETILRRREVKAILNEEVQGNNEDEFILHIDPYTASKARNLAFTHEIRLASSREPTWQAIIENGFAYQPSARKDPKYVTHGLHPYKGKFYPQLAKGLINLCALEKKSKIFDPFCGSGTTLLEGYLNGYKTYGSDIHPLAVKIAKAKVGIFDVNPDIVREAVETLTKRIKHAPSEIPKENNEFHKNCLDEIERWFPQSVVFKINWLLRSIRSMSEGVIRDFLEIVLSSIIREVSQQDPKDLRIRKRKEPIQDADVFGLYLDALELHYGRIERFWSVRGHSPIKFEQCNVIEGDSREKSTLDKLMINESSVDLILTSPPYIDTDRLSLLVLFGMNASSRMPIEHSLVGSREIIGKERTNFENNIINDSVELPKNLREYLQKLHSRISIANVGFRRKNMPALLLRYFCDMDAVLQNCYWVLRPGGEAMVVIGDNRIKVDKDYERIPTTDFVQDIALARGFHLVERFDISVTTENLVHLNNAITENVVLRLKKQKT